MCLIMWYKFEPDHVMLELEHKQAHTHPAVDIPLVYTYSDIYSSTTQIHTRVLDAPQRQLGKL